MENREYEESRQAVISELKSLIEKQSGAEEPPRAIGGPYSLSLEDTLREVENNTEIGRQIVIGFSRVKKKFP
jgi:hypothetical protein